MTRRRGNQEHWNADYHDFHDLLVDAVDGLRIFRMVKIGTDGLGWVIVLVD
jgi:hypothetical protein